MPLIFIAIVIAMQSLLYVTTQKLGGRGRMLLIGIASLLTNLVVLPWATILLLVPPDFPCGNPAIGITLTYWVFGTVGISMCHALFWLLHKRAQMQEEGAQNDQAA